MACMISCFDKCLSHHIIEGNKVICRAVHWDRCFMDCEGMKRFYDNHPYLSRIIFVPLSIPKGVVKLALFPLICLIGMFVYPLMACISKNANYKNAAWVALGFTAVLAGYGALAYFVLPTKMMTIQVGTVGGFFLIAEFAKAMKGP